MRALQAVGAASGAVPCLHGSFAFGPHACLVLERLHSSLAASTAALAGPIHGSNGLQARRASARHLAYKLLVWATDFEEGTCASHSRLTADSAVKICTGSMATVHFT